MISSSSCGDVTSVLPMLMIVVVVVGMMMTMAMVPLLLPAAAFV